MGRHQPISLHEVQHAHLRAVCESDQQAALVDTDPSILAAGLHLLILASDRGAARSSSYCNGRWTATPRSPVQGTPGRQGGGNHCDNCGNVSDGSYSAFVLDASRAWRAPRMFSECSIHLCGSRLLSIRASVLASMPCCIAR